MADELRNQKNLRTGKVGCQRKLPKMSKLAKNERNKTRLISLPKERDEKERKGGFEAKMES